MDKQDPKIAIGELLKAFIKRHPAFTANPVGDWKEFVGEQTARRSQPLSLKNKVLRVVAHDAVWKHHLEINSEGIIKNINSGRPEPIVEKIIVRVGEVPESPPVLNPNHKLLDKWGAVRRRKPRKAKPPVRALTPEEKALISKLPDPELKKLGSRLLRLLPEEE
jgi:hypothetical protein